MARPNGLFGNFQGKLGELVGYTLKGKPVLRTMGTISKPPSVKQLAVRKKIKMVTQMMSVVLNYINSGFLFAVAGTDKGPFNAAVSYNFKHAVSGDYPDLVLDYSKVLVSMGTLPPALNPVVLKSPMGLEFSWDVQPPGRVFIECDRAMLLIYFPAQQECICVLTGAQRQDRSQFVELDAAYLAREMQVYIAFVANDRTSVSNSVWVPQLDLKKVSPPPTLPPKF